MFMVYCYEPFVRLDPLFLGVRGAISGTAGPGDI